MPVTKLVDRVAEAAANAVSSIPRALNTAEPIGGD
jgi:hypothetical protein